MEKRLKIYLVYLEEHCKARLTEEEAATIKKDLLIQIGFFQHERLVHLIVTITIALVTLLTFFCSLSDSSVSLYALMALFLILLVPYIRHYYILENGVQKLYRYYDFFTASHK